mgnify:CR=1 FL=1
MKVLRYISILGCMLLPSCYILEEPCPLPEEQSFVLHLDFDTALPLYKVITIDDQTRVAEEDMDLRYIVSIYSAEEHSMTSGRNELHRFVFTKEDIAERFDAKPASKEIFVFTPNGDIRKLPEGATVLDFAFDIHTSLGSTCSGGKVNGRAVPIRETLKNGDIVEILTQKNQQPKSDWLNFVVTQKAKQKIKSVIREEQAKNANLGREELERKLKNWKITSKSIDEVVAYLCKYYKQRTGTALYELIAEEKIDLAVVKELLAKWLSGEADEERRAAEAEAEARRRTTIAAPAKQSSDALIIDESINNIVYKLAKCCNPIYGDEIFGFILSQGGIKIHRKDCPNAPMMIQRFGYRYIKARWSGKQGSQYVCTLRVIGNDDLGIVTNITSLIQKESNISMRSISVDSVAGLFQGHISLLVNDLQQVDNVIKKIKAIKGVKSVERS